MRVGLLGCGAVGRTLAGRLLAAGHDLAVHDRNRTHAEPLVAAGARWVDGPRALGDQSELLISALPGPAEVEAVLVGADGLWAAAQRKLHLETATVGVACMRRLARIAAARDVWLLDCPVSRTTANDDRLGVTLWAGGHADHYDEARPLLETLADRVLYCGGVGQGQVTKLVNNFVAHALTVLLGQGLAAGVHAGSSVDLLRAALHEGTAQTRMLDELLPASVLRGDFRPGLRLDLAVKDLDLVAELFAETGVGTELLDPVRALYAEAAARGWGDRSAHAVVRLIEESVGTSLRSTIFEQLPPGD